MDLTMSIAALSVSMHQQQYQQDLDVLMTKKIMDVQEAESNAQIEMLTSSPVPPSNHILDTQA